MADNVEKFPQRKNIKFEVREVGQQMNSENNGTYEKPGYFKENRCLNEIFT